MHRDNKIFKLCRVHNLEDYLTAVNNGVNMIGIHAVYTDFDAYRAAEEIYNPIERPIIRTHKNLPIADYEVDAISYLADNVDGQIPIALVLEKDLSCEGIAECLRLYNLSDKNPLLQLQYRINNERFLEITRTLSKKMICTIGLNQEYFDEYFAFLNRVLDPDNDFILIDFSKHQPDYLTKKMGISSETKMNVLMKRVKCLKKSSIPLLIADDTTVEKMAKYIRYLSINDIELAGIDMQNSVEQSKEAQCYTLSDVCGKREFQIKVRKSDEKLRPWRDFVSQNFYLS